MSDLHDPNPLPGLAGRKVRLVAARDALDAKDELTVDELYRYTEIVQEIDQLTHLLARFGQSPSPDMFGG